MDNYKQAANALLMVRPNKFGFNRQTANSNPFQSQPANAFIESRVHDIAMVEFDIAVSTIEQQKIQVVVEKENQSSHSPDAIFPNNFIVFHHTGNIYVQKMFSSDRSNELSEEQINIISKSCNYSLKEIKHISSIADANQYLEGTGSIVFHHPSKTAYAALSDRTNKALFEWFCKELDYTPVSFESKSPDKISIYHTNVLLSIGQSFAVICTDVINESDNDRVIKSLKANGLNIIKITYEQLCMFCANILEVKNVENNSYILLSANAFQGFKKNQKTQLENEGELLPIPINTIEKISGGSLRCMVAEIFR